MKLSEKIYVGILVFLICACMVSMVLIINHDKQIITFAILAEGLLGGVIGMYGAYWLANLFYKLNKKQ